MVVGLCAAGQERPRRRGMSACRRFECAPVEEEAAREREGRLGGRDAEGGAGHGQEQAAVGGRRRA